MYKRYHAMYTGAMPKAKAPKWTTIKVTERAHEQAKKLLQTVFNHGWTGVGATRTDVPTLGAILEESLRRFERDLAVQAK
jgi:hypothetical protein